MELCAVFITRFTFLVVLIVRLASKCFADYYKIVVDCGKNLQYI